jgi:hypothetical protein
MSAVGAYCVLFFCFYQADIMPNLAGISSAGAISISRPDMALLRASIYAPHLKGAFGESHMHTYIARLLKEQSGVRHVPVSLGRQGIDGLYVNYGANGEPAGLIVSEAKYGASSLGMTKDGIQLGKPWTSARLLKISSQYEKIVDQISNSKMSVVKMPQAGNIHRLQVQLPDGKAAVFWKNASEADWKFAGKQELLGEAKSQFRKMASLFDKAARGEVAYQRYLYQVKVQGNIFSAVVKNADLMDAVGSEASLKTITKISMPLFDSNLVKIRSIVESEVASQLQNKLPSMPLKDIEVSSKEFVRQAKSIQEFMSTERQSFFAQSIRGGMMIGLVHAFLDVGINGGLNYYFNQKIDSEKIAKKAALVFLAGESGYIAGQYAAKSMIQSRIIGQFIAPGSSLIGTSARALAANSAASALGGGVAVAVLSYGQFLLGYSDIGAAHRSAAIGMAGIGVGVLGACGVMNAAIFFGTASTGTAVSTLSGAAATNAALAWLGGGTLAAGGGGMAMGSIVVTGGGAAIGIAVTAIFHYTIKYFDDKYEKSKTIVTLAHLKATKGYYAIGSAEEMDAIIKLINVKPTLNLVK